MTRWSYCVVRVNRAEGVALIEEGAEAMGGSESLPVLINRLGADGWRMVAFTESADRVFGTYIFEREVT